MISMNRLWLHGLYGLHGPRCLPSLERPFKLMLSLAFLACALALVLHKLKCVCKCLSLLSPLIHCLHYMSYSLKCDLTSQLDIVFVYSLNYYSHFMTASVVVAGGILMRFWLSVIVLLQNVDFWQRTYSHCIGQWGASCFSLIYSDGWLWDQCFGMMYPVPEYPFHKE